MGLLGEITERNLDCIKDDIHKRNFDFFGLVLAREGDGKSTWALEAASYVDDDFNINQIIMDEKDWFKIKSKLKKGMAIVFDEGSEVAFSREAMKREQRDLMKELTQIRGVGLFMLMCISDIRNADRFIRERRAFAIFYIPKRGELWCYRLFGKNPMDEKEITKIKKALLNGEFPKPHYRNHFKPLDNPLWNNYWKYKKHPFMKKERESKLVRRMREKIEKKMEGSADTNDLRKIYKISFPTVYRWIKKYVAKKYIFKDYHGRVRITKNGIMMLDKKIRRDKGFK